MYGWHSHASLEFLLIKKRKLVPELMEATYNTKNMSVQINDVLCNSIDAITESGQGFRVDLNDTLKSRLFK